MTQAEWRQGREWVTTILNTINRMPDQSQKTTNYLWLENLVSAYISNFDSGTSKDLIQKNNELTTQINALYQKHKDLKIDLETAERRDEILRTRKTDISPHRLFLIDKPVRKGIIPALYCFSILFISAGIFFLTQLQPTNPTNYTSALTPYLISMYNVIIQYAVTNMFIASVLVFLIVLILYLSIH